MLGPSLPMKKKLEYPPPWEYTMLFKSYELLTCRTSAEQRLVNVLSSHENELLRLPLSLICAVCLIGQCIEGMAVSG